MIVDPPDANNFDLVYCVLEQVSLDDFAPEFQHFLSETSACYSSTVTKDWLHFTGSKGDTWFPALSSRILLPT